MRFKFMGFVLISALLNFGCQTNQLKQFEQLKPGMEKGEILEIMGSPQHTQRWHGMDRWNYVFYEQQKKYDKEIHFLEGTANYVGEPFVPEISAEQADAKNEETNHYLDIELAKKQTESRNNAFEGYEMEIKGNNSIRYVPQFEPVH